MLSHSRSPNEFGRAALPRLGGDDEEGAAAKFDVAILSDLLHFGGQAHDALIRSLELLLAKTGRARAYVSVAQYTAAAHCDAFLCKAAHAGIVFEEQRQQQHPGSDDWMGTLPVSLGREALAVRKAVCRWFVGRWAAV